MTRAAKPGDKITDHLTSGWFNEQNKTRTTSPLKQIPPPENPIRARCVADSGVDILRFHPAKIVGPATEWDDETSPTTIACKVDEPSNTSLPWGVVQGPVNADSSSNIVLFGLTWAIFDYTASDTHVDIELSGGSYVLVSSTSGRAHIILPPESAGKPGLIFISPVGVAEPTEIDTPFFILTEDMSPTSGGDPTLATAKAMADFKDWDNSTLYSEYLYSWDGIIDDAETGFFGVAERYGDFMRFKQASCNET